MRYGATFCNVMAGRIKPSDIIDYTYEKPKFGFYWWFWKPTWKTNGGKFKREEVVDVSVMWLCFSIGLIFWPGMSLKSMFERSKPKQ